MSPQVNYTTEVIRAGLLERLVHPLGYPNPGAEEAVDKILELYPDIPALGSPFGTGNETFGLSTGTKRIAAICKLFHLKPESDERLTPISSW